MLMHVPMQHYSGHIVDTLASSLCVCMYVSKQTLCFVCSEQTWSQFFPNSQTEMTFRDSHRSLIHNCLLGLYFVTIHIIFHSSYDLLQRVADPRAKAVWRGQASDEGWKK